MIDRNTWIEIIKDFHQKELPETFERELDIEINSRLKRAISIIGPRRSGKTYYFFNKIKELKRKGVKIEKILYINFEDFRLYNVDLKDLKQFLDIYYEIYPDNKNHDVWLFLDEIQNINGWERFVRTLLDNEKIHVFITGSSSKLLSREIATEMRGRSFTYTIFPLSFKEVLDISNISYSKYASSSERYEILNKLEEYLHNGGYPEVIISPVNKDRILRDIVDVMLFRDIVERWGIRNIKALKLLIKALIHSKEFSINKFYNFLKSMGINVSKNTLYNYMEYLSDAFFIFSIKRFSNYRESEQGISKIYVIDNGILTSYGIDTITRLIENAVCIELFRRKSFGKISDLYYVKVSNYEVDFLIKTKRKKILLQVSYDLTNLETKERELRSLIKASEKFEINDLYVITWNYEGMEKHKSHLIQFVPLWKWLLNISNTDF